MHASVQYKRGFWWCPDCWGRVLYSCFGQITHVYIGCALIWRAKHCGSNLQLLCRSDNNDFMCGLLYVYMYYHKHFYLQCEYGRSDMLEVHSVCTVFYLHVVLFRRRTVWLHCCQGEVEGDVNTSSVSVLTFHSVLTFLFVLGNGSSVFLSSNSVSLDVLSRLWICSQGFEASKLFTNVRLVMVWVKTMWLPIGESNSGRIF